MSNHQQDLFPSDVSELKTLMSGMRAAYLRGENAMEYARRLSGKLSNSGIATLISYDLQAGSYIKQAKGNPQGTSRWCKQLANVLNPYLTKQSTILEVGCGEATTLAGLLTYVQNKPSHALGFDISWSRLTHGLNWLQQNMVSANLFVSDLFEIPFEDSSIDVVYTSHSLEVNGGREEAAIYELLRVARRAVILVEPIYELASPEAQSRMDSHGYIRNLKTTIERLGATLHTYKLLEYCVNPLNPSGLLIIEKSNTKESKDTSIKWRCPLTHTLLSKGSAGFYSQEAGIVYPVLAGIPLLRANHAVVASSFGEFPVTPV